MSEMYYKENKSETVVGISVNSSQVMLMGI